MIFESVLRKYIHLFIFEIVFKVKGFSKNLFIPHDSNFYSIY